MLLMQAIRCSKPSLRALSGLSAQTTRMYTYTTVPHALDSALAWSINLLREGGVKQLFLFQNIATYNFQSHVNNLASR